MYRLWKAVQVQPLVKQDGERTDKGRGEVMSTAKRIKQPPVPNIALELTNEEAQFLADVLSFVGGAPEGRRGHAERILNALRRVDVNFQDEKLTGMTGRITCDRH
jgi:hypothetical protein